MPAQPAHLPLSALQWPMQAGLRIRAFLRWWSGELLSLVPERLRRRPLLTQDTLVLHLHDGHVEAAHHAGGRAHALGLFAAVEDGALPPALRSAIQHDLTDLTRIVVRLPQEQTLRFTLRLPVAAREGIREILGYEMDRYTPFTAEQVCFDYRVTPLAGEHLQVNVSVAPRTTLDRALRITRRLGLRLHALDIDTDPHEAESGINLLPVTLRPSSRSRRQWLNRGLLTLAALLAILYAFMPFLRQSREIHALTQSVEDARAQAGSAFALRDRRDALLASLQHIRSDRHALPPVLAILGELTERIPDDTWLQRLEIQNGQIQLHGLSGNASALLRILDESALFEHVEFRSPVNQDPRSGKESFQINAGLARRTPE